MPSTTSRATRRWALDLEFQGGAGHRHHAAATEKEAQAGVTVRTTPKRNEKERRPARPRACLVRIRGSRRAVVHGLGIVNMTGTPKSECRFNPGYRGNRWCFQAHTAWSPLCCTWWVSLTFATSCCSRHHLCNGSISPSASRPCRG